MLPAGPGAALVELPDLESALALHAEILRRQSRGWGAGLVEVVPAARTVLLIGGPDPAGLARQMQAWDVPVGEADLEAPVVEVRCWYDGPDLGEVADLWGVAPGEVAAVHSGIEHRVAFCGFAPGFGYLTGLGPDRAVPRRSRPRPRVDAGRVAVADVYTGVYPRPSPGGWRLIGRTDATLWDPQRQPPALFAPGTRVRFVAAEGDGAGDDPAPGAGPAPRP